MTDKTIKARWFLRDLPERYPIFGSQVERIGLPRVLAGGLSMYFSIPIFAILHIIGHVVLLRWLVVPLLGMDNISVRNYVILDRHKIEGLSLLDKVNCVFCGWANGLSMLLHAWLERLDGYEGKIDSDKRRVLTIWLVLFSPLICLAEIISIQIIYNIMVSRPLGLKRITLDEAYNEIEDSGFASKFSVLPRSLLRYHKSFEIRLENALEQIETSWCPLKHLDTDRDIVYPDHHRKFFGRDQIEQMKKILQTDGTVSDIKPHW